MKLTIEVEAPDHHVVPGLAASLAPEVARLASNQLNGAKFVVVSASEDGVSHPDFAVVDELPEDGPEITVEVFTLATETPKPVRKPRTSKKNPPVTPPKRKPRTPKAK